MTTEPLSFQDLILTLHKYWGDQGCAILLVSVELDEILALADRILVMNQGRIVGEIAGKDADERKLGILMACCQLDADGNAIRVTS